MNTTAERSYRDRMHITGRIWMAIGVFFIYMIPTAICIRYGAWPDFGTFLKGASGVILIFWIGGSVETITYIPMLGTGGSYLTYITGNASNLKLPCALNAMKAAGVEPGSEKGEVIATIAIAVSSIITTLIIALFVLLFVLTDIQSVFQSALLKPAFDNLLPALFGGYGLMVISRHAKIAILPVAVMIFIFVLMPSLASSMGILVPVGIFIAAISARFLYKKGLV